MSGPGTQLAQYLMSDFDVDVDADSVVSAEVSAAMSGHPPGAGRQLARAGAAVGTIFAALTLGRRHEVAQAASSAKLARLLFSLLVVGAVALRPRATDADCTEDDDAGATVTAAPGDSPSPTGSSRAHAEESSGASAHPSGSRAPAIQTPPAGAAPAPPSAAEEQRAREELRAAQALFVGPQNALIRALTMRDVTRVPHRRCWLSPPLQGSLSRAMGAVGAGEALASLVGHQARVLEACQALWASLPGEEAPERLSRVVSLAMEARRSELGSAPRPSAAESLAAAVADALTRLRAPPMPLSSGPWEPLRDALAAGAADLERLRPALCPLTLQPPPQLLSDAAGRALDGLCRARVEADKASEGLWALLDAVAAPADAESAEPVFQGASERAAELSLLAERLSGSLRRLAEDLALAGGAPTPAPRAGAPAAPAPAPRGAQRPVERCIDALERDEAPEAFGDDAPEAAAAAVAAAAAAAAEGGAEDIVEDVFTAIGAPAAADERPSVGGAGATPASLSLVELESVLGKRTREMMGSGALSRVHEMGEEERILSHEAPMAAPAAAGAEEPPRVGVDERRPSLFRGMRLADGSVLVALSRRADDGEDDEFLVLSLEGVRTVRHRELRGLLGADAPREAAPRARGQLLLWRGSGELEGLYLPCEVLAGDRVGGEWRYRVLLFCMTLAPRERLRVAGEAELREWQELQVEDECSVMVSPEGFLDGEVTRVYGGPGGERLYDVRLDMGDMERCNVSLAELSFIERHLDPTGPEAQAFLQNITMLQQMFLDDSDEDGDVFEDEGRAGEEALE